MTGGPTCTSDTTIPTFYARTPSITINHRLMTNSERYFTAMFNAMFGIWNWDLNLLTISPVHPHEGRVIPGRGGTLDVGKRNLPFVSGSQWDVKPFKGNNMHCIVQVSLRWKKTNSCQFHFSRILKHWKWSPVRRARLRATSGSVCFYESSTKTGGLFDVLFNMTGFIHQYIPRGCVICSVIFVATNMFLFGINRWPHASKNQPRNDSARYSEMLSFRVASLEKGSDKKTNTLIDSV